MSATIDRLAAAIVNRADVVYPRDIFIPPSSEQYAEINALLKRERGHMLDGVGADIMRRAHLSIAAELLDDPDEFLARYAPEEVDR